jgi:hypothetical protein
MMRCATALTAGPTVHAPLINVVHVVAQRFGCGNSGTGPDRGQILQIQNIYVEKVRTHHRCPRIRPIHEYTIFKRSRTRVVRNKMYFSSSIIGTTDPNQYGKVAGSSGGSP